MKYVKEEELLDRHGIPIEIPFAKKAGLPEKDITVGAFLYLILDAYQPSQKFEMVYKELKIKDKVLNILDRIPNSDGFWEFEDADFDLMQKIVTYFGPSLILLAKYIPRIGEKLEEALSKMP